MHNFLFFSVTSGDFDQEHKVSEKNLPASCPYKSLHLKLKHCLLRKTAVCQHHQRASSSKMGDSKSEIVMVIGGAGFLGQHVVKELQERCENVKEIRVFDLKPYQNKLGKSVKLHLKMCYVYISSVT